MAVQSQNAILKVSTSGTGHQQSYTLSPNQTVTIGRDPSCQIALDATQYKGVSRRHAELNPVTSANGQVQWQVHDLGSSNGIFINGQRVHETHVLRSGDRLALGRNGVEFSFEMPLQQVPLQQTLKISNQVNDTVYEYKANPASSPISPPDPARSNTGKIALGLAAIAVIFFVLNNSPDQSPPPEPSPQPTQSPLPNEPNSGDVDFQGTELFTQYFKVIKEEVAEDVPVKTSDGRDITIDAYVITVEAKSTFNSSDVAFTVRFYDTTGSEIGEPVPIVYEPSQEQWSQGTQGIALFKLPSDRSNLKVVRFSR